MINHEQRREQIQVKVGLDVTRQTLQRLSHSKFAFKTESCRVGIHYGLTTAVSHKFVPCAVKVCCCRQPRFDF
jgi:hypothetical protein